MESETSTPGSSVRAMATQADLFNFLEPIEAEIPLLDSKEWDDEEWLSHVLREIIRFKEPVVEAITLYHSGLTGLIKATRDELELNTYDANPGLNRSIISRILEFKDFYEYLDEYKYLRVMSASVWQNGTISNKLYAAWQKATYKGYFVFEDGFCSYFNPAKNKWVDNRTPGIARPNPNNPVRSSTQGTNIERPNLVPDEVTTISEASPHMGSDMSEPSEIKVPTFVPSPQAYLGPTSRMQPPPAIGNNSPRTPTTSRFSKPRSFNNPNFRGHPVNLTSANTASPQNQSTTQTQGNMTSPKGISQLLLKSTHPI